MRSLVPLLYTISLAHGALFFFHPRGHKPTIENEYSDAVALAKFSEGEESEATERRISKILHGHRNHEPVKAYLREVMKLHDANLETFRKIDGSASKITKTLDDFKAQVEHHQLMSFTNFDKILAFEKQAIGQLENDNLLNLQDAAARHIRDEHYRMDCECAMRDANAKKILFLGMGIVAGLVVVAIIVSLVFWIRSRMKSKKENKNSQSPDVEKGAAKGKSTAASSNFTPQVLYSP